MKRERELVKGRVVVVWLALCTESEIPSIIITHGFVLSYKLL